MMLRSSSTPVLGSLLSSYSDSPNKDFENKKNPPSSSEHHHHLNKISFSHGGNLNFSSFSCNTSPFTHSISGFSDSDREFNSGGFRRAQSEGNLKGLAAASCDIEEFCNANPPLRSSRRSNIPMLQTIPSFSIYNSRGGFEEKEDEDEEERESEFILKDGFLQRSVTIGENIMEAGTGEFSFGEKMGLIEEEKLSEFQYLGVDEDGEQMNPQLFLARGLGIDVSGSGGGGDFNSGKFGEDGGQDGEEYYKKMVEENPCSPLFLRNYAQFLYQSKGDLRGADEYYSRAILADPQDGEILSQYAKLVWELHHDHERASSYFERAVQAAPEDSHVHAAYASFLWETEDCEEEAASLPHNLVAFTTFHGGAMTSATA
ncbi:RNA-processing protein [Macleaya cordata]|uniref:RNA-processing protein n=1 Tax=Macleaya cordata TaxID=56857 RepID=A0A200PVU8_MACCD|nr:RNA-processing protein [Macleaya cordata]